MFLLLISLPSDNWQVFISMHLFLSLPPPLPSIPHIACSLWLSFSLFPSLSRSLFPSPCLSLSRNHYTLLRTIPFFILSECHCFASYPVFLFAKHFFPTDIITSSVLYYFENFDDGKDSPASNTMNFCDVSPRSDWYHPLLALALP